jgi:hypothetical protein
LKDNESNKNTIESVQIEADKHRNELMQIINDSKIAANIAQQTLLSRD